MSKQMICPWCGNELTPNQKGISLRDHKDTCALYGFSLENLNEGFLDGIKEGKKRERRHQRYLKKKGAK